MKPKAEGEVLFVLTQVLLAGETCTPVMGPCYLGPRDLLSVLRSHTYLSGKQLNRVKSQRYQRFPSSLSNYELLGKGLDVLTVHAFLWA